MLKLASLNTLSNEKNISAEMRKKYRAQKFALLKRIEAKLQSLRAARGEAPFNTERLHEPPSVGDLRKRARAVEEIAAEIENLDSAEEMSQSC